MEKEPETVLLTVEGMNVSGLRPGDRIILTVSGVERTPTGYVLVYADTALGRGNTFVMPPEHSVKVARRPADL